MKAVLLISLTFLSIVSSYGKGICERCFSSETNSCPSFCGRAINRRADPVPRFTPIVVGKELICSDGTFSLSLLFNKLLGSDGFNGKDYSVSGYGVYGPRLSGNAFETVANLNFAITRAGEQMRISGSIPFGEGSFFFTQTERFFNQTNLLRGTVFIDEKSYMMTCK